MKVKVSAVSYLNTLPFLYGIKQSGLEQEIDLSLDIPSDCARKLLNDEVDLGLVPVAIIPQLKEHHIISDYCIGADGPVDTVALFSDVPLEEIENIYLDYHSRSSVTLVQLLAKAFWKIKPNWIRAEEGFIDQIQGTTAGVVIGDRTFGLSKKYKYDLAEAWKAFTGKPFVFAAWVSNKPLPESFIEAFNQALGKGVQGIDQVVANFSGNTVSKAILEDYLSQKIDYRFDEHKKEALQDFLNHLLVQHF